MTVADAPDPHDLVALLERLVSEGAEASICAEDADVAPFVWIGQAGLAMLAEELERLRDDGHDGIEQAAYVAKDGALIVVGQGSRGAFAFRVSAGGWGWCRPLV
jgi:hypothetical protein